MQQNDHGPSLPSLAAAIKASMNDIVFREIAWAGRGKAEVSMPVEFNLCWLSVRRSEIRPLQKFERFLQPPIIWLGRHHQCRRLNGRPVHQFCQWRDHVLFFRPVSNLGASQRSTRPFKPGTKPQQIATCPCGNRQISAVPTTAKGPQNPSSGTSSNRETLRAIICFFWK